PKPTSIQVEIDTLWEYATDGEAVATVYDQYGSEITGVSVVFKSSDYSVFVIDADTGYCVANNLGQAEVWAEAVDWWTVKSDRIVVSVLEELPIDPPEPDVFPSAPLRLEQNIEFLSTQPFTPN